MKVTKSQLRKLIREQIEGGTPIEAMEFTGKPMMLPLLGHHASQTVKSAEHLDSWRQEFMTKWPDARLAPVADPRSSRWSVVGPQEYIDAQARFDKAMMSQYGHRDGRYFCD